ncbi:MAG TPA: phage major capsid protein, partial [Oculatellaceae cyanobacterium]
MPTLYDLKEKLATVGNQLKNVEEQLVDKAANPAVTKEEIEELKNKKADLQQRFELLKEQHDKVEKEQQAKIKQENPISVVENEEGKLIAAKAELIRAAI